MNKKITLLMALVAILSMFVVLYSNSKDEPPEIISVQSMAKKDQDNFKKATEDIKKILTDTSNSVITMDELNALDNYFSKYSSKSEVTTNLFPLVKTQIDDFINTKQNNYAVYNKLTAIINKMSQYNSTNQAVKEELKKAFDYGHDEVGNETLTENGSFITPKPTLKPEATEKPNPTLTPPTSNIVRSNDSMLELTQHGISNGYITGTIVNKSSRSYSFVEVRIALFDKDGNQRGSTLTNVANLQGNKSWNFKAAISEKNTTSYKIVEIKAGQW